MTPRVIGDNPLAADELLPLWVADMDFPAAQPIIEALTARARHGVFGYTQPSGGYFTAIVNWIAMPARLANSTRMDRDYAWRDA